jgi:predicted GNAT family acetyltransferase
LELPIEHEEHGDRGAFFVLQNGKRIAELTYSRTAAQLATIDHTQVDPALRGQGIARRLLDAAVNWARANQVKFSSTCSYASAQFVQDRSIRDVLA